MEEIDIRELLNFFKSKCYIIVILTLLILVIGLSYQKFFQTPLYKSYTTILLTKDNGELTMTDLSINQNLVDTYSELIKSKKIAKKVISNLDIDMTSDELIKNITVESVNDTEMIKITVINESAKQAKEIANEIATTFEAEVVNYYDISNIGIVDKAELANNPYNINLLKQALISALVGFVLGLMLVFLIYYFDRTLKTKEEIENKIGLSVIAVVPQVGGKKK